MTVTQSEHEIDALLQSVLQLARQVKRLAEHQAAIESSLSQKGLQPQQLPLQRPQTTPLHFPSPSIVDMSVVESPFLFHCDPEQTQSGNARADGQNGRRVHVFGKHGLQPH